MAQNTPFEHYAGIPDCNFIFAQNNRSAALSRQAKAALGTSDETTLLVIGRESATDSLDAHAAATGKALSGVYENYRLISGRHVTIAGLPAVEQRSRGTADGRDWSVVLVTFMRGNDAFTLLGMTWADYDLIQVQENVIAKTVNSLTFAPQ